MISFLDTAPRKGDRTLNLVAYHCTYHLKLELRRLRSKDGDDMLATVRQGIDILCIPVITQQLHLLSPSVPGTEQSPSSSVTKLWQAPPLKIDPREGSEGQWRAVKGSEAFIYIMHRCAHSAKLRRRTLSPLPKDQFLWPSFDKNSSATSPTFDDALCRYFQALWPFADLCPYLWRRQFHRALFVCHMRGTAHSPLAISSQLINYQLSTNLPIFLVNPIIFTGAPISKAMVSSSRGPSPPGGLRQLEVQSSRWDPSRALRRRGCHGVDRIFWWIFDGLTVRNGD